VLSDAALSSTSAAEEAMGFTLGLKMATVIVTIMTVMCVFPFLQKHFIKGVLIGAIKS
jgi:putative aldouronate transport system permease protein